MPTQGTTILPTQTNPPRTPLLPVKKVYTKIVGTTSQLLRGANLANRGIRIENRSDIDVYISVTGSPASTNNIRIKAGDDIDWPVGLVQDMWIIAPGAKDGLTVVFHEFV